MITLRELLDITANLETVAVYGVRDAYDVSEDVEIVRTYKAWGLADLEYLSPDDPLIRYLDQPVLLISADTDYDQDDPDCDEPMLSIFVKLKEEGKADGES